MKIKHFLSLILMIAFAIPALAQSVVITPKKTTYTRPKPLADFKKNFTINYPKVKASSLTLSRKIEAALSYEKNFDFAVRDELGEMQWLEEADFEVVYNKNGVLTIKLFISGSGAYPSGSTKTVVVDLQTGNRVRAAEVFTDLNALAAKIRELQKAEIKQGIEEIKKDPDAGDNAAGLFENADFTPENLEGFAVDERGVTFDYDYGFPRVIQALEPEGVFFLSWAELKPDIKPTGLLGRFVR